MTDCEVLRSKFYEMLKTIPNARYVELVLVERYDDGNQ